MKQDDRVPPHGHERECGIGKIQLLDEPFARREGAASLGDKGGNERPAHHPGGYVGQVSPHLLLEKRSPHERNSGDEDAEAQRRPQRSEHGSSIAPLDFLPAEARPNLEREDSIDDVGLRKGVVWFHATLLAERVFMHHWGSRVRVASNRLPGNMPASFTPAGFIAALEWRSGNMPLRWIARPHRNHPDRAGA